MAVTGGKVDAQEALSCGLVREVCAPEELLARARQLAMDLVSQSAPVSVALIRQLMWRMLGAGADRREREKDEDRKAGSFHGWLRKARAAACRTLAQSPHHVESAQGSDVPL